MKKKLSKKSALIISAVALVITFILLANEIKLGIFAASAGRVSKSVSDYVFYVKDTFKSIKYVSAAKTGIQVLTRKNISLDAENQALKAENEKLKRLLSLRPGKTSPLKVRAVASVISATDEGFIYYYTVDKGSDDGVEEGDGVLSASGVIGRVAYVSPSFSKVQLINDAKSSISARIERSRVTGIVTGSGVACEMNYVPKEEDVEAGDIVVSSGIGRSFPEGLKIGTVSAIDRKAEGLSMKITVKPFSVTQAPDEVLILRKK